MREIGGYFELERYSGSLFPVEAIALNCGRNALAYLIELRGIRSIWLPDFLCASVPDVCLREGVSVKTYQIGKDFLPIWPDCLAQDEWFYLVDYYGQLSGADVENARKRCGNRLIVDESHGFFRLPWSGADTLYTARKYFGVADGAFLVTRDGAVLSRELVQDTSADRMGFVLGRLENTASEFYAEASANNKYFKDQPVKEMSQVTQCLLRAVDYGAAQKAREANFSYLCKRLSVINKLDVKDNPGPYAYPLLVDDAAPLKKALIANKVYVATLWPDVLGSALSGTVARYYAGNIIPIPVDQRYGLPEMAFVADLVLRELGLGS